MCELMFVLYRVSFSERGCLTVCVCGGGGGWMGGGVFRKQTIEYGRLPSSHPWMKIIPGVCKMMTMHVSDGSLYRVIYGNREWD